MPAPGQSPSPRHRRHHRERSTTVQWVCDLLTTELMTQGLPDDVLPSEDALIKKYAVSRGVVREVLQVLQDQGMIERVRGAGTFVLAPSIWLHAIDESRDLAQEVNERGTRMMIRMVHKSRHPATAYVAERLQIGTDEDVIILETSTTLDGFPLSVRTAFMPGVRFAALLSDAALDLDRTPYDFIPEVLGEPLGETELYIKASAANSLVAETLRIDVGAPTLDTSRVVRDRHGVPVEYSISHARGDRLIFATVMRVPGTEPEGPVAGPVRVFHDDL